MLDITTDTSITIENLEQGVTYRYIVQPISYIEIADNVSPETALQQSANDHNFGEWAVVKKQMKQKPDERNGPAHNTV